MANAVSVVIQTKGAKEAGTDIKSLGDSADKAAPNLDKAGKSAKGMGDSAEHSRGLVSGLGGALGTMGKIAGGIIIAKAFEEGASAIKGAFKAAVDYQIVQAQTVAVIESTGSKAGVTAKQVIDLGNSLEQVTLFGNDVTQTGENMLLTFTNIGANIFPQVTETMLDMSQAMGQDTKTSALLLGKALNDPIKGMSALTRVGVAFTDGQKATIKSLQESGDLEGAQAVILKELQNEYGGAARAAGSTFGGQLAILKNNLGDMTRDIAARLLPALVAVTSAFVGVLPPIIDFVNLGVDVAAGAIGALFDAVSPLIELAWDKLSGPLEEIAGIVWDALTDGVGLLETLAGLAWDGLKDLAKMLEPIVGMAWDALKDGASALGNLAGLAWDGIKDLGSALEPVADMAWDALKDGVDALGNLAGLSWDGLKDGVGALKDIGAIGWDKVKDGAQALKDIAAVSFGAVSGTLKDLGTNIKGVDLDSFKSGWEKIKTALQPAYDLLKPLVDQVLAALKDQVKQVGEALKPLGDALVQLGDALKPLEPLLKPLAIVLGTVVVVAIAALLLAFEGLIKLFTFTLVVAIDGVVLAIKGITIALDFVTGVVTEWAPKIWAGMKAVFDKVSEVAGDIVGAIKGIPGLIDAWQIGSDIVTWIAKGIVNMAEGLYKEAKAVASKVGGILNPKNWFGSPQGIQNWYPYYFAIGMNNLRQAAESNADLKAVSGIVTASLNVPAITGGAGGGAAFGPGGVSTAANAPDLSLTDYAKATGENYRALADETVSGWIEVLTRGLKDGTSLSVDTMQDMFSHLNDIVMHSGLPASTENAMKAQRAALMNGFQQTGSLSNTAMISMFTDLQKLTTGAGADFATAVGTAVSGATQAVISGLKFDGTSLSDTVVQIFDNGNAYLMQGTKDMLGIAVNGITNIVSGTKEGLSAWKAVLETGIQEGKSLSTDNIAAMFGALNDGIANSGLPDATKNQMEAMRAALMNGFRETGSLSNAALISMFDDLMRVARESGAALAATVGTAVGGASVAGGGGPDTSNVPAFGAGGVSTSSGMGPGKAVVGKDGNIPGIQGYDVVWTPGAGWQYVVHDYGGSAPGVVGGSAKGGFTPGDSAANHPGQYWNGSMWVSNNVNNAKSNPTYEQAVTNSAAPGSSGHFNPDGSWSGYGSSFADAGAMNGVAPAAPQTITVNLVVDKEVFATHVVTPAITKWADNQLGYGATQAGVA